MSQLALGQTPCYLANADARYWLQSIPDNTFHAGVTDGPYEIGILGNRWDKRGAGHDMELWSEMYRVLRPGAMLVAFAAPKTYHRLACVVEDCGFEIRDMWPWLKGGAAMAKGGWCSAAIDKYLGATREVVGQRVLYGTAALSTKERGGTHSVGVDSRGAKKVVDVTVSATPEAKQWEGWHYNMKPMFEPAVVARKPCDGTTVENLLRWGCGAINAMAAAIPAGPGNTRMPPNVGLTPEAAEQLGAQSGRTKCASNKKPTKQAGRAFHGNGKPQVWAAEALNKGDEGTAARYFPHFKWCRKANSVEKVLADGTKVPESQVSVKPEPLIEWMLKLVVPPAGLVIDPFAGTGTTLRCASRLGMIAYGCELHPAHYEFAMASTGALKWEPES